MFFRNLLKIFLRFFCQAALRKYHPFIIAVTGNTGKTSTKEAIFTLLKEKFKNARATPKNFNTDIGVPLAILGLEDARRNLLKWIKNFLRALRILIIDDRNFPKCLVLEIAADKPGEIAYFAKFLPIDIGIVTTIGRHPVHLEFFPNRDRLIEEKAYLAKGIKRSGSAILNKDDADVSKMASLVKKGVKILFYGKNQQADIRFSEPEYNLENGKILLKSQFWYQDQKFDLVLQNIIGEGNLYAISAALACGVLLDISLEEGIGILEKKLSSPLGRMKLIQGIKESLIIDDTYNASPLSYFNALECVNNLKIQGRKIVVLGDMAELGEDSDIVQQKVVNQAMSFADVIVCVGPKMKNAFMALKKKAKFLGKYYGQDESPKAVSLLTKIIQLNDLVFIKGAQVMRMERIVKNLMKNPESAKDMLVRQEEHWINKP